MEIPQKELDFCQKLVELAKEHGTLNLTISYQVLRHDDPNHWREPITIQWHRGRHDERASVMVESTSRAYLKA